MHPAGPLILATPLLYAPHSLLCPSQLQTAFRVNTYAVWLDKI
jgi:hypothetical protein